MSWLRTSANNVVLALHIQPGAKKTEIAGPHGDALKLRLAAPPVDGKANEVLIDFLSDTLGKPKAAITLVSGQTSRSKRVAITDITVAEIEARLFPAARAGELCKASPPGGECTPSPGALAYDGKLPS